MNSRAERLAGPVLLLLSRYAANVIGPLVGLLVVRYLGPEQYGQYASAIAISALFGVVSDFGLQQAALEIAAAGGVALVSVFRSMVRLGALYTVVAYGTTALWVIGGGYDRTVTILVFCLGLGYFQAPLLSAVTAVLQLSGEYVRIAVWNAATATARWVATLLAILSGMSIYSVTALPLVASWIVILAAVSVEWGRIPGTGAVAEPVTVHVPVRELFRRAVRFGTAVVASQLYHRADSVLLSLLRAPVEVGYYAVAFRVVELLNALPGIVFNQVLYPKYFRWFEQARPRLERYYHMTSKWMLGAGVAAAAIVSLLSYDLVRVVFGSEQSSAARFLSIMAWAVPARFVAASAAALLTTGKQITKRLRIQAVVAVANIVLNAVLIPLYGGLASAFVIVGTETLLLVWYASAVKQSQGSCVYDSSRTAWLSMVFVAGCVASSVRVATHDLGMRIGVGAFVLVLAIAYLVVTLTDSDRLELRKLIG